MYSSSNNLFHKCLYKTKWLYINIMILETMTILPYKEVKDIYLYHQYFTSFSIYLWQAIVKILEKDNFQQLILFDDKD